MGKARDLANVGSVASQGLQFRNKIINGDMRIDQRNAGAVFTCGSNAIVYGLDRWTLYSGSSSATGQRVSNYGGFQHGLQITGASGNAVIAVGQRIEQANAVDLAGQTITVSFTASASIGRNISVELVYPNAVDNYGSGVTAISSTTVAVTTSATRYTVTFNVPSAATTGLRLEFAISSLGAGQTFTVTGVQLEKGTQATPFEFRPIGTELALCQRYFQIVPFTGIAPNTSELGLAAPFKVPLRAAPSVSTVLRKGPDYTGTPDNQIDNWGVAVFNTSGVFFSAGFQGVNGLLQMGIANVVQGRVYGGSTIVSAEL